MAVKTVKVIQSEIDDKVAEIEKLRKAGEKETKQINQLKFLRQMKEYVMQVGPSGTFLKHQQELLTKEIKILNDGYETWCKHYNQRALKPSSMKGAYGSEVGLPKKKKQLKTLKYLLSKEPLK